MFTNGQLLRKLVFIWDFFFFFSFYILAVFCLFYNPVNNFIFLTASLQTLGGSLGPSGWLGSIRAALGASSLSPSPTSPRVMGEVLYHGWVHLHLELQGLGDKEAAGLRSGERWARTGPFLIPDGGWSSGRGGVSSRRGFAKRRRTEGTRDRGETRDPSVALPFVRVRLQSTEVSHALSLRSHETQCLVVE